LIQAFRQNWDMMIRLMGKSEEKGKISSFCRDMKEKKLRNTKN